MKKNYFTILWLIILTMVNTAQLTAQPYEITFGMRGKSGTPDSVYVENLQKGTDLMLMGDDILLLTTPTIAIDFTTGDSDLTIFPNPVKDKATIRFYNPQDGAVTLKLVDISGRKIAIQKENLPQGDIRYLVSGIPPGTFLVQVNTSKTFYSKTLISTGSGTINPNLSRQSLQSGVYNGETKNTQNKSAKTIAKTISMEFSTGDNLTFHGYYTGAETKVDTVSPVSDLEFEFDYFYYTLTDYDFNTYLAVEIGNQVWMAENLKVTHYPDGTPITLATNDDVWKHVTDVEAEAVYCYYDNDKDSEYGVLYSWPAALGNKGVYSDTNPSGVQGVCPAGWHLPSQAEWIELRDFIRGEGHLFEEGKALKSISGWAEDGSGTDDYGFCALPGGQRGYVDWDTGHVLYYGSFIGKGNNAVWWLSNYMAVDAAASARLVHISDKIQLVNDMNPNGLSIRCVRDIPANTQEGK